MGKNVITVKVENKTGKTITKIKYRHRYDEDVYDDGRLSVLAKNEKESIGAATYWTGFFRYGFDYWWIQFNRNGVLYTCKTNFFCYLTSDDAEDENPVILILRSDKMEVIPPVSSKCSVRLYKSKFITKEHIKFGISEERQPEDPSKKCSLDD